MDDEKQPMPVIEKTAAPPPPPLGADTKPASAAAQAVAALPNPTRNIQTALRILNDATGLLQQG